jgi:flagellar hook protein FlgE
MVSGTLELSTVDLATEFVTMLASQRAFQVNSRVITTADEMYSVAAELKA